MWVSSGVAGSYSKDCSMGWGKSQELCFVSWKCLPCESQFGDWAEGVRMGCCVHREGMRPISGHTRPVFLGHPEKGVLSTLQSLPISPAELSAETCRAAAPVTMLTSVHTSAWSHSVQPSPLANRRTFHHPQRPPSPISSHSESSLPKEPPISNFHNVLF